MRAPLSGANPLVLAAVSLLSLIASSAVRDVRVGAITVVVFLVVGRLTMPRDVGTQWRYLVVVVSSSSVAYSTWLLGGHDLAESATAALRICVLALPGVALAPLIDASRLADELAQRLAVPARLAVSLSAAWQRLGRLNAVMIEVQDVRRVRGAGPERRPLGRTRFASSVAMAVLASAIRDAATMAVAMDSRGFAQAHHRTWAEQARWSGLDTAVLFVGVALSALPFVLGVMLPGGA